MEWINGILASPELGFAVLPASLLLGLLTAFSSCCNLGIIAAIAGYAGSHDETFRRRDAVLTSVFFLLGTVFSMALLGLSMGYLGQLVSGQFGKYGLIITGFAAIFFGLFALEASVPFLFAQLARSGFGLGTDINERVDCLVRQRLHLVIEKTI